MTRKEHTGIVPAKASDAAPEDRIEITYVRVEDLKPYGNNPRVNDDTVEPLMNSMREFGTKVPPVVLRDGTVVTGHTRLKAALAMGKEVLPCIVADDLDDAKAKMFRLADNKIQELSGWDFPKLADELQGLEDLGFQTEDFAFTPLDITLDDPFASSDVPAPPEGLGIEEESGSAVHTVHTVLPREGDRVRLGNVTLICGSATLPDILDAPSATVYESDPETFAALVEGWERETGGEAEHL